MDRPLHALFRPRHILMTLVVAFLTGTVGLTVAANAGDEALPDAWVGDFATPMPNVGDRGRYTYAGGDNGRTDGYWPTEVSFEWLADGVGYDANAARMLANQLLVQWGNEEAQTRLHLLEPGTGQEFGYGHYRSSENGTQPGSLFFPERTTSDTITHLSFGRRAADLWCGIRNPLQGQSIDLTARHDDFTSCWNGPHSWSLREYSIVVHAAGGVAPLRTAIVDSYMTKDLDRGSAFMRSAYLEGFPYPTRVEFGPSESTDGEMGYAAAYELVGYARGSVPIASEPEVLEEAPPALVLAPRTETGPDAAGFEHPYPLATAWQRAKSDTAFTGLQDYLAEHPGAYIGQAKSMESLRDGQTSYEWYVVLTDGHEQFGYRHIHTPGPASLLPAGSPVAAPVLQRAGGDSFDRLSNGWEDGPFFPQDQLPDRMPTVATLAHAWSVVAGRDDANSYGFDLRCWDDDGVCKESARFFAGHHTDSSSGITPTIGMDREIYSSHLDALTDGRMVGLSQRETTQDYQDLVPSPSPAAPPGDDGAPADLASLPDHGWLPTPREAAAVGAAALLATLAYWLWPLAKGGMLGLFSRVRSDNLLENPLRQQIVQRVEAEPGIHHNALVRDLGRGKGALEHHLDKLVAGRILLRHRTRGYTCYFPTGTDRRSMAATAATKADGARKVMAALHPEGSGVREVAAATGLAPSTVSHHLQRLREAGLVRGDGLNGYSAAQSDVTAGAAA